MAHQDEEQTSEMLGRNPDRRNRNFYDNWGIKEWASAVGLLVLLGSSWAALYYGQKSNASAVMSLGRDIAEKIERLEDTVETARKERDSEIRELQSRVSKGEAERAVQNNKLDNMEDIMRDIRSLMREDQKG